MKTAQSFAFQVHSLNRLLNLEIRSRGSTRHCYEQGSNPGLGAVVWHNLDVARTQYFALIVKLFPKTVLVNHNLRSKCLEHRKETTHVIFSCLAGHHVVLVAGRRCFFWAGACSLKPFSEISISWVKLSKWNREHRTKQDLVCWLEATTSLVDTLVKMLRLFTFVALLITTAAQNEKACVGKYEFVFFARAAPFSTALSECEQESAQLAVPFNQAENNAIACLADFFDGNRRVWLGILRISPYHYFLRHLLCKCRASWRWWKQRYWYPTFAIQSQGQY